MRILLLLLLLLLTSCGNDQAGTATDVNSGSLSGKITHDDSPYQESIDLYIRETNSGDIVNYQQVTNGEYHFDSLRVGRGYDLVASIEENSVTLGYEQGIIVQKGSIEDIPIARIVKKAFAVTPMSRLNLIVDSLSISNVYVKKTATNQYQCTFGESKDTTQFTIHYTLDKQGDSAKAVMYQKNNLAYTVSFLTPNNTLGLINLETVLLTGNGSDSSKIIIDGTIE